MPDLEYYQECRNALRQANDILLEKLPLHANGRAALKSATKAIGIRIGLDPSLMDRLYEFTLYEPTLSGMIWARCALDSYDSFAALEREVVEAALRAEPSVFEVTEVNRADRTLCLRDLLRDRPDIWIVDLNLSQTARARGLLFCRPIDMGSVCFASGATIAFGPDNKAMVLRNAVKLDRIKNDPLRRRKQFAMFLELEKHSSVAMVYK